MDVEKELSLQKTEDEKISNSYVLKTVYIILFIDLIFQILNEFGLFFIDKLMFRSCFLVTLILTLFLFILSRFPEFISPRTFKYIIIINVILITLINTTVLSFHSSLLVILPMVISTHYHSSKISTLCIIGSCLCAFVSPIISLKLNTFDASFLVYLLRIISPEKLAHSDKIDSILKTRNFSSLYGLISFYCFPHFMIVIGYGVITRTVYLSRIKSQKARVTELKVIQDNILYSVADLIENRDSNTGTHVKRTSEVVRILVNNLKITDSSRPAFYWNAIINAAPMHDLGKIAIQDSILKKPGKLTPEEFEIIKGHSQKSAEIIEQMLGKIETKDFLTIAKNIARFHHEKWNGEGYPSGLKGEAIPYEARIMAIADVFDALVSERCYKQAKTPEEAFNIIKENMGSHFDPSLLPAFEQCFNQLKEYYNTEKNSK